MSARRKRWVIKDPAPPDLARQLGCPPLLATLFVQRDLRDPAAVHAFIEADYRTGLHDPLLMRGMAESSARIAEAIQLDEPMAVYGDFDTDGVTAATLLKQAIGAMGGTISAYIPHRTREGYGLNREAVAQLAAAGVRLLITVDCGISNVDEVAFANSLGLDVIITDHHSPPEILPAAFAVVNPKQPGCAYPYKQLVGVGIAFKLVQALVKRGLKLADLRGRDLLDVVAVGTVTDMGPLDGENRVLVKAGLEALNATARPGLLALIEVAGLQRGELDSTAIGFTLGPRLNAAGRLDDAVYAYELLLTDDRAQADVLAKTLNETNRARQDLTRKVQAAAREQAEASGKHLQRIVVLDNSDFPAGVVGLVAGKLVEDWGRPVLLIERGEDTSRGSARSVPGFNIIEALRSCDDLFVRYGGHAAAAGFTIANENIPLLERQLLDLAATTLDDQSLQPALTIDAEIDLDAIDRALYTALKQLEPFGQGNPIPMLMSRGVEVRDARPFGSEGRHLLLQLVGPGGAQIEGVAWNLGGIAQALMRNPRIDVAYTIEERVWNRRALVTLNIKRFATLAIATKGGGGRWRCRRPPPPFVYPRCGSWRGASARCALAWSGQAG
ncbi:single-stranded-DNA-specific exonuclease RecJ [Candidatus Gracilibacteria bacterium]|nr:single-stranded-DNA-specific exonuclease RecJ [Candidatus Gracilibacteria bacterium]